MVVGSTHNSIMPLTLKQISQLKEIDNRIMLDTFPIHFLCIFGYIISLQMSPTSLHIVLEDGTATATCRLYDETRFHDFNIGECVAVTGSVKIINEIPLVNALSIAKNIKPALLLNHYLRAIKAYLKQRKNSGFISNHRPFKILRPISFLSVQNSVLAFYESNPGTAVGHDISVVLASLGGKFPHADIKNSITILEGKGLLYRTIDSSHHRSIKYS